MLQMSSADDGGSASDSRAYILVGIVAGVVVVIAVAVAVVVYVVCFKSRYKAPKLPARVTVHNNPAATSVPRPGVRKAHSLSRISSHDRCCETQLFQLAQVKKATRNFMHQVGEGGFGPVYYGKLASGQKVAVKVQAGDSQQGEQEFFNEVHVLSRAHHPNLVALVGYCNEDNERMLIYEYCSSGTLEDQLHEPTSNTGMDWKTRLTVALDAATGLEYLHTECHPPIIHRDVKSSNILLTENMVAKVADFGLSKLAPDNSDASHVTTIVKGTSGYLDPEYFETQRLTQKSDVYSFGIVLLEILSGREPLIEEKHSKTKWRISDWARKLMQDGNAETIVDPALGKDYDVESMLKVAELALFSVEARSIHRPSMSEVVKQLKEALAIATKEDSTPADSPKTSSSWSRSFKGPASLNLDHSGSRPAYTRFEFYDSGPAFSRSFSISKINLADPDYKRLDP